MAARRAATRNKRTKKQKNIKTITTTSVLGPAFANLPQNKLFSKQVLIGALVVALALLIFYKKHWFVPATVNGMPVLSPQVITRLYTDYRLPAVNELIDERLIMAEARKNNALPTPDEVKARMAELEAQVGGRDSLNSLLAQEGTSRGALERRLKTRVALEKIYAAEATVSAQEVDDFVKTNKSQLTATGSAEQRVEAEKIIRQSKLGQIINEKFAELRAKANIKIF